MDRNALIEILQQEGNLKHCFSHDEIERLAAHLSIETVQAETVLMKKGKPPAAWCSSWMDLFKSLTENDNSLLKNQAQ